MKRLKSIDEIYEEVSGYDLVITNDVALETALNSRIATPRIGTLAITPRHIAKLTGEKVLGHRFLTDLELVSQVSEETHCKFRQVCSEIINIREIRRHTKDVKDYLPGATAKKIYDSYSRMPTLERAMSETDVERPGDDPGSLKWYFEEAERIAVVGVELFNDLDKHYVPYDCEFVDIFKDGDYSIDEMHVVGNDRQLAENAAELIDREHPEDFAIVMCADQPIADAVRSSLYRRSIPFVNSMAVSDLAQIRDYISLLGLSFDYRTLRVRDVMEIFTAYHGFIERGTENYLLCRVGPRMKGRARDLYELMARICDEDVTFGDALNAIPGKSNRSSVFGVLVQLGFENDWVTPEKLADMRFAVENVQDLKHSEQIPDYEKTGVLLADCKNSVFVDRPVVIYLGLDDDWTISLAGKKYIRDREGEAELNADRLTALIQQGQRRVYCVNRSKDGRTAIPSRSFDIATGAPVDGFASLCTRLEEGGWAEETPERVFEIPPMSDGDVETALSDKDNIKPFSKSSFNPYTACPRKYMLHELIDSEDNTNMEFGNLIHEFAELYACYPGVVAENGIDTLVDMVAEEYAGISSPAMDEFDRSKIRRAMENVMLYLDGVKLDPDLKTREGTGRDPNRFMERLGLDGCSDACETDHVSSEHEIHGKFDLYSDGRITDYKTGRMHDVKKMRAAMDLENIAKHPEFQPLIYLALAKEAGGSRQEFDQFYALGNDVRSLEEGFDISENVCRVSLCPDSVERFFSSEERVEAYRKKLNKDVKPFAEKVIEALAAYGIPAGTWKEDEGLVDAVLKSIGDPSIKREQAAVAVNHLWEVFNGRYLVYGNDIVVSESALEEFLAKLDAMHAEATRGRYTDLPAKPRKEVDCRDCDYFEVCTGARLATDDGGGSDE